MTSHLPENADGQSSPRSPRDGLSSATIHDLLAFLTTIEAHAQLLQRRLRRSGTLDQSRSTELLVGIDRAATELATRLNGLRRDDRPEDDRNHA